MKQNWSPALDFFLVQATRLPRTCWISELLKYPESHPRAPRPWTSQNLSRLSEAWREGSLTKTQNSPGNLSASGDELGFPRKTSELSQGARSSQPSKETHSCVFQEEAREVPTHTGHLAQGARQDGSPAQLPTFPEKCCPPSPSHMDRVLGMVHLKAQPAALHVTQGPMETHTEPHMCWCSQRSAPQAGCWMSRKLIK